MTTASVTEDLKAVRFAVAYEGHPVPATITAAALRKIASGNTGETGQQLLETFLDHRPVIEALALRHVEEGEPCVELTVGCFN